MILWQVFNRHGRSFMAQGDTAEEAIENARPLFASNWVWAPWREAVPDPAYVFEGMRAFQLSAGDVVAEALQRYEAAAAVLRAGWSSEVPAEVADTVDRVLRRHIDAELSVLPARSPFRERPAAARAVSPGCYAASFGWVHMRPGCRCSGR